MNKSFVRGGQLSLHSLRMLKQVIAVLIKLSVFLFSVITVLYSVINLNISQFKAFVWYGIANIHIMLDQRATLLKITGPSGQNIEATASSIYSSWIMNKNYEFVIQTLYDGVNLSTNIIGATLIILTGYFLIRGGRFAKDKNVRGNAIISAKELKKAIHKYNKSEKVNPYSLGDVYYPANSETTHTLISGTTGAGKTVLMSDLIAQIKKRGDKAIIFDKMGVYTERFFEDGKDILLNPFDERSPTWNIFNEVSREANFDAIASALIPKNRGDADPFWIDAARTLFHQVCCGLYKKGGATNTELVNTLLRKDLVEAAELVKGTSAAALIDEKSPKTALSVMSILSTNLKSFEYLKDGDDIFSIKDWIKDDNGDGCLFLTSTGDLHQSLTSLISAWINIAITNVLSLDRNKDRKIWFILDELPSLHNLPSLQQGLAETRQFGGCFVLSIQSISQLRERYGSNGSQTISSLCNNKIFLRAGDHESAKWYSENIGISEVEEFKEGLSYGAHQMRDGVSINHQRLSKPLVLPTELVNLGDLEGYFQMAKCFPVAKVKFKYSDWPLISKRLIEAQEKKEENDPVDEQANTEGDNQTDEMITI